MVNIWPLHLQGYLHARRELVCHIAEMYVLMFCVIPEFNTVRGFENLFILSGSVFALGLGTKQCFRDVTVSLTLLSCFFSTTSCPIISCSSWAYSAPFCAEMIAFLLSLFFRSNSFFLFFFIWLSRLSILAAIISWCGPAILSQRTATTPGTSCSCFRYSSFYL